MSKYETYVYAIYEKGKQQEYYRNKLEKEVRNTTQDIDPEKKIPVEPRTN